jgi:uncharacterized protein YgiM (DUF1202 family)/cbb3-type cytochrome oxidase subunit 3
MLDVLLSPQILGLIFIALIIIGVIVVVLRRRRRAQGDGTIAPPVELGQQIDYTSMTVEEPTSLVERFRNAPPAMRALIILVPLVVIGGLIALALALTSPPASVDTPIAPTPPAGEISITRAEVAGNGKIVVVGTTNLPNDATITATMQENGQPYAWFTQDSALTQPSDGKISLTLDRSSSALVPTREQEYTIILVSNTGGQTINSPPMKLNVLQPYESDFYQSQIVAEEPTATPLPTATPAPNAEPPAATAVPAELTGTVIGGGRIRKEPSVQAEEVGQVTRGESVTLLERTQDGAWFRISGPGGDGWVSSTLLEIDPAVAAQVPAPAAGGGLTTTVFNGGNVRPGPGLSFNPPLDQVNAGESVTLLERTADDQWYKITNVRGITGWVNRTLLNLSVELSREVPVTGSGDTTVTQPTPPSGLAATVFNGGNVRATPALDGQVLDQVNAGESVTLLAKTSNARWYQIVNERKVTGWVSVTLLTIDPDVASQVPVSP